MKGVIYQDFKPDIQVVSSSEATIAQLSIVLDGETLTWEGTAKRDLHDRFNYDIGARLALSRALAKAARQLERQANGFVKSAEDNRAASVAARTRPRPNRFALRRKRNAGPKALANS